MKVVFLTNHFYPVPNANGVCIKALADEVVKRNVTPHVICYGRKGDLAFEEIDGIIIHRLRMPVYMQILDNKNGNSLFYSIKRLFARGCALFQKLLHAAEYPLRDRCLMKQFVNVCSSIISDNDVNIVVSSYTPYEAVKAGTIIKQKYPTVKTVYYSLDTLSNEGGEGVLPVEFRTRSGIQRELSLFTSFDTIVLMRCHEVHYQHPRYKLFEDKIVFVDFPLFKPELSGLVSYVHSKNVVYAGSLYRLIRNPEPVLDALLPVMTDYTFHFYGDEGNCMDILDKYESLYPQQIIRHGLQRHNIVQKALMEAEVLLSIGNTNTEMSPSKIYEYISMGKPIIHSYSSEMDSCLTTLGNYPNAFCFNATQLDTRALVSFLENPQQVSFYEDSRLYAEARPGYTIDAIIPEQR